MKTIRVDYIAAALCFAVAGGIAACTTGQLTNAGLSPATAAKVATVTQTMATDGTLACNAAGLLFVVANVNVKGASAQAVTGACNALADAQTIAQGAAPAPAVIGAPATVVTAPAPVVAAVAASVGSS